MKTKNNILIFILFLACGCGTKIASYYNSDIKVIHPESFLVRSAVESSSYEDDSTSIDHTLVEIIAIELKLKGLSESSIPDLYVHYTINVFSSSETRNDNNFYNTYSRYGYADPFGYNYSTTDYKEGVLIIDIKNDRSKLVWQGSKSFKIKSRAGVQEALPQICRAVIQAYNPEN